MKDEVIHNAKTYARCDDLYIITTYFNPYNYHIRLANYMRFIERIKATGLHLLTVECTFGKDTFELPCDDNVIQIHGRDLMWQRERLLNIGIASLPDNVKKIAWVDAELLFTNPQWAVETSNMLDVYPVVQPFQKVILLQPGASAGSVKDQSVIGFGYQQMLDAGNVKHASMKQHGHTGFSWAFRRDVLASRGLYDAHIGGDGDHLMAHAMCGDFDSACVNRVFTTTPMDRVPRLRNTLLMRLLKSVVPETVRKRIMNHPKLNNVNTPFHSHFLNWALGFYNNIQGRIGAISGTALHLWHGNMARREYNERREILKSHNFDPHTDLRLGESGCWEWNSHKPELHRFIRGHFQRRREDDVDQNPDSSNGISS